MIFNNGFSFLSRVIGSGSVPGPGDVTNLQLWLSDGSDFYQDSGMTTPVASDADPVGYQSDLSGAGNPVIQATAGSRPLWQEAEINGLDTVQYDGSDDALANAAPSNLTNVNQMTWFIVAKQTALTNGKTWCSVWNAANTQSCWAIRQTNTTTDELHVFIATILTDPGNTWIETTDLNLVSTTKFLISMTYDGTEGTAADRVKVYKAGSPVSTGMNGTIPASMTNSSAPLNIGCLAPTVRHWNGDIGEIVVYNTLLSTANHNLIGNYLGDKWGITWTDIT